jgi:hypothetical protein
MSVEPRARRRWRRSGGTASTVRRARVRPSCRASWERRERTLAPVATTASFSQGLNKQSGAPAGQFRDMDRQADARGDVVLAGDRRLRTVHGAGGVR